MKKTVHMIGNAHLDPVWLWDWREGFQENQATLLSALNRLDEFDDFIFTCSSAQFYEWIEENNPELFSRIQKYVEEGRWIIVGGWWVQPDCNIPNGEAFARQSLISQTYFREHFGRTAKTGYCVDSFGHNAMLPQILKKSGMENYVFQRPSIRENPEIPAALFRWEAPDGSAVNTYRLQESYCVWENIEETLNNYPNRFPEGINDMMLFYGVGNHGGGPTIKNIELVQKLRDIRTDMDIRFSDPDTFFEKIKDCALPVVKGELQHHAAGCYAAESMVKQMNRRAENALLSAEKLTVMAEKLGVGRDPADLTQAWKQLLFNQFHDTLAGSGMERAYYDARNQLGEVVSAADRSETRAVRAIAYNIGIPLEDTTQPIVVFNPHSWAVKAPVEVENGMFGNSVCSEYVEIADYTGKVVPFQRIDAACKVDGRRRISFLAEVPALGYATYYMKAAEDETVQPLPDEPILENEYLRVEFDPNTGGIASILDKRTGRQVLSAPVRALVFDDDTDTWGHSLVRIDRKCGEFALQRVKIMDKGAMRTCIKITSVYGTSTLTQLYSLYAGDDKILVDVTVNWQEHRKALKLEFPVAAPNAQAACEIPFGHLEKKMDGREEPMQQWADISGDGVGLSVLNDSKYSVDFHENTIGFTALRSPVYAHHDPYQLSEDEEYSYIDQGIQHFRYALLPHGGCWRKAKVMQAAALLNQPLITTFETFHEGTLPQRGGAMTVSRENIQMTALKKAYRGDAAIVRLIETFGEETEASVSLFGTEFFAVFKPYEIKTFALHPDGSVQETDLLECAIQ